MVLNYDRHKYLGLIGLISLIGLKGFTGGNPLYYLFFINVLWFTLFYENSYLYKKFKTIT